MTLTQLILTAAATAAAAVAQEGSVARIGFDFEVNGKSMPAGKYEVKRQLGKGAMGTVYEGWDPIIQRRVAIKTVNLPDSMDEETEEALARFKREAQAAGRLTHANIVGVFDYGESPGLAYIVMEFIDGVNLRDAMRAGRLTPAEALKIVPQV